MKPDQIVTQIAASAGITHEQAETAFTATVNYLKTKLPDSVSSQVDGLLQDQEFDFYAVIKDKLYDLKEEVGEKLENLKDEAKEKFEDLKDGAKEVAGKVFHKGQP